MHNVFSILSFLFISSYLFSQQFSGAGNSSNIKVYSSSNFVDTTWQDTARAANTINGSGLLAKEFEASRFLKQATMGFDKNDIDDVVAMGIENWLDDQLNMTPNFIYSLADSIQLWDKFNTYADQNRDFVPPECEEWIHSRYFDFAWWQTMLTKQDKLNHRIAFALSEIFVISRNSDLNNQANGLATFYDLLLTYQSKTFENLLLDITLDPSMGYYLSLTNSQKADTINKIFPDENYAREIMQLFSIGLFELKVNGTKKNDINGFDIPTYSQNDIKELARTISGFGAGGTYPNIDNSNPGASSITTPMWLRDLRIPMQMFENYHDNNLKSLIRGANIIGNRPGLFDTKSAIKVISNHSNVGPFLAYRLIQRLIKSNPSPEYIERVAKVFNNDGNGVRGNMKAFIKAIFLDEEARNCNAYLDYKNSKLVEPFKRYTNFVKIIKKNSLNGFENWNIGRQFNSFAGQNIFEAPSVFNFYLPDHSPNGQISNENLVAPEFNVHNSTTSIGYLNEVNFWLNEKVTRNWSNKLVLDTITVNYQYYNTLADDTEELINYFDLLLTYGNLSDRSRTIFRNSLNQINYTIPNYLEERTKMALYLFMISPDYNILH